MRNNYLLERERKNCFDYFYENFVKEEKVYGLMPDTVPSVRGDCSVAANGFMLAGMAIGADFGYISRGEAQTICEKTLETLIKLEKEGGFFYHFYHLSDGRKLEKTELSLIDTALLIAGALTAGAYFGGKTMELANRIYSECDWEYFYCKPKRLFYMGKFEIGFSGYWDCYAEQLIVYFLAAGSEKGKNIAKEAYYSFTRLNSKYRDEQFIFTWFGSLFTHQYSHAFIDFKGYRDMLGTDWFQNSVKATLENRKYCIDHADVFKGYGENGWGLTSCQTADGYKGAIGAYPSGNNNKESVSDGTIAPCGALGSVVFTPAESLAALEHFYSMPQLTGEYGLYDAYNEQLGWFSKSYISIDKGITLLMAANYEKQTVWKSFCGLPCIKKAFEILEFQEEKQ